MIAVSGTLRKNRKNLLIKISKAKPKKGKIIVFKINYIIIFVWRDKRIVHYISNIKTGFEDPFNWSNPNFGK